MNEAPRNDSRLPFMLRALSGRNYRIFFAGQIVSLMGTWMTMVATSWLVYRLAREADQPRELMLGLVGFSGQIPALLLTPLAGVWIDRWNRRTILIWTQALAMLQSFALAALALSGVATIGQLMALSLAQGLINAFDVPARQAFVVELVDRREDLSNAIALNSSMFHAARMVGPALAGYLIYQVGEGICFLIDGFSYLAVLMSLLAIRVAPRIQAAVTMRALASLREGLRYALGFAPIWSLLALVALTSLTAMSQATLMPIFAAEILGGDELTLGWLSGFTGLGALFGSLYLASRRSVVGLGRVITIASACLGIGVICFSQSSVLWLSLPILIVNGGAVVVQMASANTMLQTIVDDDKRGRMMALFTMSFFGMAPFASLLAGSIAWRIGAPYTLALAGSISLLTAVLFSLQLPRLRPLIRPIYVTKGILPGAPATTTAEAATE